MRSNIFLLTIVGALYSGVFLSYATVYAQSYEDQAKTILQLFESGQKDTAYALLEPLKKHARFVPAVIYTRARMTPDDRALALFKEVVAMEPGGRWADQAALQLVSRYVDKRDSLAAYHWTEVLRVNYPRSPLVADAEDLLDGVRIWRSPEEDSADTPKGDPAKIKEASPGTAAKAKDPAQKEQKKAEEKKAEVKKPAEKAEVKKMAEKTDVKKAAEKKVEEKKAEAKKDSAVKSPESAAQKTGSASEVYKSSGMKGYAIQVGIFPSRNQAEVRSGELKKKNIRSVALPKVIDGKKQYALVVGPYQSIEDANKKKPIVASACDCKAFIVKVQ